jgi:hypothetical protein
MFKILTGKPKYVSGIILNWTAMMFRQDFVRQAKGYEVAQLVEALRYM